MRLRGVTLPGLANAHSHAFQRALRGRTQRGGGSFWTWREDMYALAATHDARRHASSWRKGTYAEMLQGRDHVRRRVRLPALQRRADRRRERDRHPAHAARRLLPRGRLRRAAERRAAALQRRRRRALGRARVADQGREGRRRDPLGPRRPARADPDRRRVGAGQAAALPRLRAARRERGVPGRPRLHAGRNCWREHGALGPNSTAVHATHLTDDDERAAARDHDLHVPDDRARPRRRHRPRRPEPAASAATATRSSTSSRRPAPSSSTCGSRPSAAATSRRRRCCAARPTTRASAGPTPAGSSPARSPTSSRSASTRRGWRRPSPTPCSNRSCSPPPRPTSRSVIVGGKPC